MYKLTISLLILCMPLLAYAKESPEEIILHLPSSIHGLGSGAIKSYKEAMLGSSMGYNYQGDDGEICATLYVYDMNIDSIPDGIESDDVRTAYKYAKVDIDFYEKKGIAL